MIELALLPALLLAAVPQLELDQAPPCLSRLELEAALDQALEDLDRADQLILALGGVEQDGRLSIRLSLRTGVDQVLLDRRFAIQACDCTALPPVIALMVRRRLDELPGQSWARVPLAVPEAPAPAPPMARSPWLLRLGLGVGGGLGVQAPVGQTLINLGIDLGHAHSSGWRLSSALRGSAGWYPLGPGTVQVLSARLSLGPAYDLELNSIVVSPRLLLDLGGYLASGSGFDRDQSVWLPALALRPELLIHTRRGAYLALGLELPLLVPEFYVAGLSATHREPWLRLQATAGFIFDLLG